jgi:ribonuclease VapC
VIVDTSAIIAVLRGEPDAARYIEAISRESEPRISAGTYLETALVIDGTGDPVLSGRLDDLVAAACVKIEPLTQRQVEIARHAYRAFGRGSGHPARLNFGDCFAYALARDSSEPLLFKGDDFSQTDVLVAPTHGARGE